MKWFIVKNIKWDTNGEVIPYLPREKRIAFLDEEDALENAASILSDDYGFCVFSFLLEEGAEIEDAEMVV